MNGMPRRVVISLQLPGDVLGERLALDDARPGDQEEGPGDADLVARELHAPAATGSCEARCARAARTNPVNSGWPSRGVEVNSGWNCVATNQG